MDWADRKSVAILAMRDWPLEELSPAIPSFRSPDTLVNLAVDVYVKFFARDNERMPVGVARQLAAACLEALLD